MRTIRRAEEHKKAFLPLLLLGDEQESMIDRYLERGELYVMEEGTKPLAVAVVTQEEEAWELKNLAVDPTCQRRGLGREMIEFICRTYGKQGGVLLVGTGETPSTLAFYKSCGFSPSHRIKNFFTEHYDHLIVEEGVVLKDMVYLKRRF